MTLVQTVYCQGNDNRCWQALARTTNSTDSLYTAARAFGWQARPGGPDLCPSCKKDAMEELARPRSCPGCVIFPHVEFRDSLGHDSTGHRTTNTLVGQGITTWDQLLALRAPHLRKMRGLGDMARERIIWAQEHPKEKFA